MVGSTIDGTGEVVDQDGAIDTEGDTEGGRLLTVVDVEIFVHWFWDTEDDDADATNNDTDDTDSTDKFVDEDDMVILQVEEDGCCDRDLTLEARMEEDEVIVEGFCDCCEGWVLLVKSIICEGNKVEDVVEIGKVGGGSTNVSEELFSTTWIFRLEWLDWTTLKFVTDPSGFDFLIFLILFVKLVALA